MLEETKMARKTEVEVSEVEVVQTVMNYCDEMGIDELKTIMAHCQKLVTELQKSEVDELEAQMRAIQDKLMSLKGNGLKPVSTRKTLPVINPENPSQVYTCGKLPDWLKELMEKTGKNAWELRQTA
jgi:uncharacterized coiled-coil protein SlyX